MSTKDKSAKVSEAKASGNLPGKPAPAGPETTTQAELAAAAVHKATAGGPPLDPDECLALQRTAGNIAFQRLLATPSPPSVQRDVSLSERPMTGAEADTVIRDRFQFILGRYVESGGQLPRAEGRIHIVDDQTFRQQWEREYDTPEDRAAHPVEGMNAFVDYQGQAWIHQERGTVGTLVHEALHIYSNPELLERHMGRAGKESMTEWFTSDVLRQMGEQRYYGEYAEGAMAVGALINFAGRVWVENAFFRGRVTALSHHVDQLFGQHRTFLLWCRAMQNQEFGFAQQMFELQNRARVLIRIRGLHGREE